MKAQVDLISQSDDLHKSGINVLPAVCLKHVYGDCVSSYSESAIVSSLSGTYVATVAAATKSIGSRGLF